MKYTEADRRVVIKELLELSNPPFIVVSKSILKYYSAIPYNTLIRPLVLKQLELEDLNVQQISIKYKVSYETIRWIKNNYFVAEPQKDT